MRAERTPVGWGFWLRWALATTAGWTMGLAVLGLIPRATSAALLEGLVLAAAATLAGVLQWLILRGQIDRASWWVTASAAGWIAGLVVFGLYLGIAAWYLERTEAIGTGLVGPAMGSAAGFLVGTTTGALQWLILRQQVRRAAWWILTSIASWTACLTILSVTPETSFSALIAGALLGGAAAGGVSGAMLCLLLRPPSTRFISLRTRLVAIFVLLLVGGIVWAFFWFYGYAMGRALDERGDEMTTLANIGAAGIDGGELVALYEEGNARPDGLTDDARYWQQISWLETVRGDGPYALYTFVRSGEAGDISILADTLAADGSPRAIGFRETRSVAEDDILWQGFNSTTVGSDDVPTLPALLAAVTWQHPSVAPVDTESRSNERRAALSGYAPIRNGQGEVVGALGIDLQNTYVANLRADVVRTMLRAAQDPFAIMLIIALLVSRSITKPIVAVTEAARRIGRGEFEQDLSHVREASFFQHEIDELASAIEESGRVHISERHLRKEVEELKIRIDEVKRRRQVKEIVEDDFFQDLQSKAKTMRAERRDDHET